MTTTEALKIVETLCGGDEGFHRVWKFIGDAWDKNLEDLCLQKQFPEQYVERAKEMHHAYKLHEFNLKFEEKLVNTRVRK